MKAFITSAAILTLVSGLGLTVWIIRHGDGRQSSARGTAAEAPAADAKPVDLGVSVSTNLNKAPRSSNPAIPITATNACQDADYLATHILEWPTTTNSLSASEAAEWRRLMDIETFRLITNKVMIWSPHG